jgi:SAM-dependent methyltransferase
VRAKTPDREFFRQYWFQASNLRWPYRYQWFLRPCREHAFAGLCDIPPGPILEVGGGLGSLEVGERDPSTHHLELFPELLPAGRGIVGDAQMLPLCDASVAVVWTQTVSMHMDLSAFVNEARRILRDNGLLVLIEPLFGHPMLWLLRRVLPARKTCADYPRYRDLKELTSLFREGTVRPYYLFSPLLLAVPRIPRRLVVWLQGIDTRLLHLLPGLSRYAWYSVALFRK